MIKIENATKSFQGINAIENLSLSIEKGEILGLLGANGAGKSNYKYASSLFI